MRRERPSNDATTALQTAAENVRLKFMVDRLFEEKRRDKEKIAELEQMINEITKQRRMN